MILDTSTTQNRHRQWHMQPEKLRARLGATAANWTEDELYQADQTLYDFARRLVRVTKMQLRKERRENGLEKSG